jgi:non-homologous end joining protein Ku
MSGPSSRLPLKYGDGCPMTRRTDAAAKLASRYSTGKADPMDDDLRQALTSLIRIRDEGNLVDRASDEGGYMSQELEDILDAIEAALDKA